MGKNLTQPEVVVVAAVALRDNELLLARRSEGSLAGYWEFPGGKVEQGETNEQALRREIQEELSVDCRVGQWVGESSHPVPGKTLKLVFYRVELLGEPKAGDAHDAVAWVTKKNWETYRIAPADIPVLKELFEC